MKARRNNKKIFKLNIVPNLFSIEESNNINDNFLKVLISDFPELENDIKYLINSFYDAKLYGSLINVKEINFLKIFNIFSNLTKDKNDFKYLVYQSDIKKLFSILNQCYLLNLKYDIVITNPPYMTHRNMDRKLVDYLKLNYSHYMMDFLAAFTKKCLGLTKVSGFTSLVTTHSWMFSSAYSDFRKGFPSPWVAPTRVTRIL